MFPVRTPLPTTSASVPIGARGARHAPSTPGHWLQTLTHSPQLATDLQRAGLDVSGLLVYADASSSQPVKLSALRTFLDPKPRGGTMVSQSSFSPFSATQSSSHFMSRNGWDASSGVDWSLLNGTRDITLLCSETAALHPNTEAGRFARRKIKQAQIDANSLPKSKNTVPATPQGMRGVDFNADENATILARDQRVRNTDRRTGHRLDYVLPQKQRFEEDAYYLRIVDQRRSEESKTMEKRRPQPILYYGEIIEGTAENEQQRKALEDLAAARRARTSHLVDLTQRRWGPLSPSASSPALTSPPSRLNNPNPAEWLNTQQKIQSISNCPSATENTYNRCFHLDELQGDWMHARSRSEEARAQKMRDNWSRGRDWYPAQNHRIQVIPPSAEAKEGYHKEGPNGVARFYMDQKRAAATAALQKQEIQQTQQQQTQAAQSAPAAPVPS